MEGGGAAPTADAAAANGTRPREKHQAAFGRMCG